MPCLFFQLSGPCGGTKFRFMKRRQESQGNSRCNVPSSAIRPSERATAVR